MRSKEKADEVAHAPVLFAERSVPFHAVPYRSRCNLWDDVGIEEENEGVQRPSEAEQVNVGDCVG